VKFRKEGIVIKKSGFKRLELTRHKRKFFDGRVLVKFRDGYKTSAVCSNISLSGVKLETFEKFPEKEHCHLDIFVDDYGLSVAFTGRIVRCEDRLCAIKFDHMTKAEDIHIKHIVNKLSK
jgi:hypothetical protein